MKTVIVGQGPNQKAWKHGIDTKIRLIAANPLSVATLPLASDRWRIAEKWAEVYCARVAITGSVGERLARLLDVHRLTFYRDHGRRNLNARWNGKDGRGDRFDMAEARIKAKEILEEPFDRYVLLGANVARAFGFEKIPWLDSVVDLRMKTFLIFPHPSGLNPWWNDKQNRLRAAETLREFLNHTNQ